MSSKRKTQLSLQDKNKIIEIIEAREIVRGKLNFTQIARDFNTHRTRIGKIAKDSEIFKSRQTLETQCRKKKNFMGLRQFKACTPSCLKLDGISDGILFYLKVGWSHQ